LTTKAQPRGRIIAAFAAVYLIWGSTYLAIRFAVETTPPFLMAAVRFLLSGVILYWIARARGSYRPSLSHWKSATIVGALLLVGGNGAVVWAEQTVPSGITALIVAILPFWIVILEWVLPGHRRPTPGIIAGLIVGIVGLSILLGPAIMSQKSEMSATGGFILILGSLSWALGSLYAKRAKMPSPILTTGMEMLSGGVLLLICAFIFGEPGRFDVHAVSRASLLGVLYLATFGSLIGFTAYIYLLEHVPASRVATYAYVNPVVAVILGWFIGHEPLTLRTVIAAAVIIGAVALITTARSEPEPAAP
jgi:drug/metabolite transporter (DMT)-like permease